MAGITTLVSSYIYTGTSSHDISTIGGDAVLLISYSGTALTGATLGGLPFTNLYTSGNASVWYLKLPTTSSSVSLAVTCGSGTTYGYYVLQNGGGITIQGIGYKYCDYGSTCEGSYGGHIDIPLATAYTSPGNLCLGMAVTAKSGGTYFSRRDSTATWIQLSGTSTGTDGKIIHTSFMKTTSGGAEEWNIGLAYGGFYSIAVVVEGYDVSPISFTTLL